MARTGLTSEQAAARLRSDGPNQLPQPERRRALDLVLGVVREPMLLLLLAAAGIYLLLGDPGEAAVLGASVLLVIALTVFQEQKSERALQALRELGSPRARVLRDGEVRVVSGPELVVGDVILVAEGDRVPADARVLEQADLHVDESMLTGESVPVPITAGGESLLHASTLVVRGRGSAEIVATGARTQVGRIGASMATLRPEPSPLQREMRHVVAVFALLSLASCLLVIGLYVSTRGGWLDALLAGVTLAMANIPEEFPVVLTVFLGLGAWRMAQHRALVRRAAAIEALGSITVLCTDKTGTLTRNRMAVAELASDGIAGYPDGSLPAELHELLSAGVQASQPLSADPMERALRDARSAASDDHDTSGSSPAPAPEAAPGALEHLREYPLSPACPAVAHAWLAPGGSEILLACKGAPETVARLCRLGEEQAARVLAQVDAMARRGLRVLGVCKARWPAEGPALPAGVSGFDLQWLGLVAFADPLRDGVTSAVAEAQGAGIRVIMLTGDHLETARAIAREAGIDGAGGVALGQELDGLDPEGVAKRVAGTNVFARVRPEHKLRLVEALKASGEVVAMTGDGVNDAPALMAAHVGIAMGERGTDVAREAASIVLLDDDFVTVVRAIRLGRSIYDNISRAVRYIMAVHIPITGLALLPMLTGGPLILLPLHVVFLELIIDPACSIVFEREPPRADLMQRPPRPPGNRLLDRRTIGQAIAQGGFMFALVTAIYLFGAGRGIAAPALGALAFTALVSGNLGLILLYRSGAGMVERLRRHNLAFWIIASSATALLIVVTQFELPASWFGFTRPPLTAWLAAFAIPLLGAVALDLAGARFRRAGA